LGVVVLVVKKKQHAVTTIYCLLLTVFDGPLRSVMVICGLS
jgi:hypothetical protein